MRTALVLAGGTGSRMGEGIPKQYRVVAGKPIIQYVLEVLAVSECIDAIQIVADEMWHMYIKEMMSDNVLRKFRGFSMPGETRQGSVLNGLKDIEILHPETETVLIHDAARPLLSVELIGKCFGALKGHDGVLPVLPMKDTVYYSENGTNVSSLLERPKIYAGQAPEVFRFRKYLEANEKLSEERFREICGSTEPAIEAGMDVVMIPGDEMNFKITTSQDMARLEEIINGKKKAE